MKYYHILLVSIFSSICAPMLFAEDAFTAGALEMVAEEGFKLPDESEFAVCLLDHRTSITLVEKKGASLEITTKSKPGKRDHWTLTGDFVRELKLDDGLFRKDDKLVDLYNRGKDGYDVIFIRGKEKAAAWSPVTVYFELINPGKIPGQIDSALKVMFHLGKWVPAFRDVIIMDSGCRMKNVDDFPSFEKEAALLSESADAPMQPDPVHE